jgi:peptidoglycan/xylan/chitin deacetylase (PgdA/CDA1 family)
MKRAVLNLMRATGGFAMFRSLNRHRALILTYHRFSERDDEASTPAAALDEQLAYLTEHYRIVPLSELVEHLTGKGAMPPGLAAITIDDGYRDAYQIAYPLLRRYRAPATVFVVTEFVEGRIWLWTDKMRYLTSRADAQELVTAINGESFRLRLGDDRSRLVAAERINSALKQLDDYAKNEAINLIAAALGVKMPETPTDEFTAIDWQQAREMDAHGVEIGSHTVTHPILTKIDEQRLHSELKESRVQLESKMKRRIEHFCYPNGNFDQRVRGEVAKSGYSSAVTTVSGLSQTGDDLLSLRRIHTESDLTHFMQSTSGFEEVKDRLRQVVGKKSPTHNLAGNAYGDASEYRPAL